MNLRCLYTNINSLFNDRNNRRLKQDYTTESLKVDCFDVKKSASNPIYWQNYNNISFTSKSKHIKTGTELLEERKQFFDYIPERARQFSAYEKIILIELTDKEFDRAKTMFYIPQRGDEQLSGYAIAKLAKFPKPYQFERVKKLLFVEGRSKNQFSGDEIEELVKLNEKQFKKVVDSLLYIPERKDNQFKEEDIVKLILLRDEKFEEAKTLFYVKELEDNQLDWNAIERVVKLNPSVLKRTKALLKFPFYKEENEYWLGHVIGFAKRINDDELIKFTDLVENENVICLRDARNIVLYKESEDKYLEILDLGYPPKNASIMANMYKASKSKYESISNLLNALNVENYMGENISNILNSYLQRQNSEDFNIDDFTNYVNSVEWKNLEKMAPEVKNYSFEERLEFFDYHYKLGTKDFSAKNLTLDNDLTTYLMENYATVHSLNQLFYRYPATSRNVGEIPKDWMDLIPKANPQKVKEEIYSAINDFQKDKNVENFSKKMTDIFNQKVDVKKLNSGSFGTGYKISTENTKPMCLKIFFKKSINIDRYRNVHGPHIEVQTGLFLNKHSNEYVRMHFGRVAPFEIDDGFLVTEFLSEDITPSDNEDIDESYHIVCNDVAERNIINSKIIDYGAVYVGYK